jgi:hypothetical protein
LPTQHEHAREIRELLRYSEFADRELDLWSYVASRVWNSLESRRTLFDRAVVWMLCERVLLPGISVLSRLVTEVRAGEYDRIHAVIAAAPPPELVGTLVGLLEVPEGGHVSDPERLRRAVTSISGQGLKLAVERAEEVFAFKTGQIDLSRIPPIKKPAAAALRQVRGSASAHGQAVGDRRPVGRHVPGRGLAGHGHGPGLRPDPDDVRRRPPDRVG